METRTIFVEAHRVEELEKFLDRVPEMLAGTEADVFGIARGFKLRIATAFFSLVKEAFIVKSRGGTDEAGISWPKLSPEYLAYKRPHVGRAPPKAGGLAPGGKDGFMTAEQLAAWRKDFARALAWLANQVGGDFDARAAKSHAAAIAWSRAKQRGVQTKLQVFGSRPVEILRDRGVLFNSLSPGVLSENGVDATYSPADNQRLEETPGLLIVGTNVSYARYHQIAPGVRPFWPKDGSLPQLWVDEIMEIAISGLRRIGEIVERGEF